MFRNARAERETVSPEVADAMAEVFLSASHALVNDGLAHTAAYAENGQYILMEIRSCLKNAASLCYFNKMAIAAM